MVRGRAVSAFGESHVVSNDGSEVYVFENERHVQTRSAQTGQLRYAFAYDEGLVSEVEDADGNVTIIERDPGGVPMAIVGPYGQRTELVVNADGYLESIEPDPSRPPYIATYHNAQGLLATFTNPRGVGGTFEYDELGRIETDVDAAGAEQRYETTESAGSRVVLETSGEGREKTYAKQGFDSGAREQRVSFADGSENVLLHDLDNRRVTTLADGTVVEEILGEDARFGMQKPAVTTTTRLPSGLQSVVVSARLEVLASPIDPLSIVTAQELLTRNGNTWTTSYTAATRTRVVTSPESRVTTTVEDEEGRPVQTSVAGLHPVFFTYDADGRLETVTQGSGAEARVTTSTYWSDPLHPEREGYLQSVAGPMPDPTMTFMETTTYVPDVTGRPLSIERADGEVTLMSYDGAGNVESVTPPGRPAHEFEYTNVNLTDTYMPPSTTLVTAHDYNLDREPTLTTLPDGRTVRYDYDTDAAGVPLPVKKGQLTRVVTDTALVLHSYHPTHGKLASSTRSDAQGTHALSYTYDGSWLKTVTWSGAGNVAGSVERVPDSDFRVDQLKVNGTLLVDYGYDNDGLMTSASGMTISRRADNGILNGTALGSVTTAETVTPFGELDIASASYSGGVVHEEDIVTRDQLGRITEKADAVTNGAGMDTATYEYDYDPAGRLVDVMVDGSVNRHYEYDPNGNRIAFTSALGTVRAQYDDQDRLLNYCPQDVDGLTPIPGLPCFRYEYRESGSLLSKTDVVTGDVTMYDYDEFGNLLSVALPDGRLVEYEVDAQNRRVGKIVDGVVVQRWLYQDQLEPVAELDGSNAVVARYVYGTKSHVPDYMVKGGVTYRIVSDHLGSVRLVVNTSTGAVAQRMDYDEWGNVTVDTAPGFQAFGFAGGIYDADTGLVRFGARDYDSVVGRWTAKDPIKFHAGDANLYAYVFGEPINRIDPTGLDEEMCGPPATDQCIDPTPEGNATNVCLESCAETESYELDVCWSSCNGDPQCFEDCADRYGTGVYNCHLRCPPPPADLLEGGGGCNPFDQMGRDVGCLACNQPGGGPRGG